MKPVLVVSFPDDPADALKAFELLQLNFRCEFEFASLYDVEEHSPNDDDKRQGWNLRQTPEAHQAYQSITSKASIELLKHEASGVVPTVSNRHLTRPSPNEYEAYCRLARKLLVEDRPGGDEGKRLLALKLVGVFNDQLKEEGLLDLLISTHTTRKLYTALRASVPGIMIQSGVRTYASGVNWSEEAKAGKDLPVFRAPYS